MKGDRAVFDCRQAKNKMGYSFAVHEVTNFTNLWSFHWFSGFCALWSVYNLRISAYENGSLAAVKRTDLSDTISRILMNILKLRKCDLFPFFCFNRLRFISGKLNDACLQLDIPA